MATRFDRVSPVTIIGAGKISYTLGRELIAARYNINSVFSRSFSSARELAFFLELDNCSDMSGLDPDKFDVFFLSVPDSKIKDVALEIFETGKNLEGKLFIHLSGSKSTMELKLLEEAGAVTASMHIMQTFPQREEVDLTDCFCAIESNNKFARDYLHNIGESTGLKCFTLSAVEKVYYHLSGVMAANFINANFEAALITSDKIKNIPDVLTYLYPTASKTLLNIKHRGISEALSGPVQRNDIATIKDHVTALKRLDTDENLMHKYLLISYLSQSILLISAASKRGEEEDYSKLLAYLEEEVISAINN